jgi:hypothetical protein
MGSWHGEVIPGLRSIARASPGARTVVLEAHLRVVFVDQAADVERCAALPTRSRTAGTKG